MQAVRKQRTTVLTGEILALIDMGAIAFSAGKTGFSLLLFPELAALSHDVFARPRGKWASQPWQLVLTPTITAFFGLIVVCHTTKLDLPRRHFRRPKPTRIGVIGMETIYP
jgi:hypothetical protein